MCCTELFGLFWTLSIVLYVEDKRPQRFGDWICLRPQVMGQDKPTQFDQLERASLNHWTKDWNKEIVEIDNQNYF
jgi:hypothetical protein